MDGCENELNNEFGDSDYVESENESHSFARENLLFWYGIGQMRIPYFSITIAP